MISLPNIFKRINNPTATDYFFTDVSDIADPVESAPQGSNHPPRKPVVAPDSPIDYAKIQAEAILSSARQEAEEMIESAKQSIQEELDELRETARSDGYRRGFAEGMANAMTEGKQQREQQAIAQGAEIKSFLESAAQMRDQLLEEAKDDMKALSLLIAEKVIRVSLKSSGDILMRMIGAATEKHRRCEWVQIYLADCDVKNLACTTSELAKALSHLSGRVHIIPMADEESGTCIIEMPDEIIDASVSTQIENVRTVLSRTDND